MSSGGCRGCKELPGVAKADLASGLSDRVSLCSARGSEQRDWRWRCRRDAVNQTGKEAPRPGRPGEFTAQGAGQPGVWLTFQGILWPPKGPPQNRLRSLGTVPGTFLGSKPDVTAPPCSMQSMVHSPRHQQPLGAC